MSACGCRSVGECTHIDPERWKEIAKQLEKENRAYFRRLRGLEYDIGVIYDAHNDGRQCPCPYCNSVRKYRSESAGEGVRPR